ncbi:MAG: hypothetical protein Kow00128_23200 [Deltaproteobacteria bacterium]
MTGRTDRSGIRWAARLRPAWFLLSALLAGGLLAYGIFREEIGEVMFNAAML